MAPVKRETRSPFRKYLGDLKPVPTPAPGAGTPEICGFTIFDAQKILRALHGLSLVGGDVVEVSIPPASQLWRRYMMFAILRVVAIPSAADPRSPLGKPGYSYGFADTAVDTLSVMPCIRCTG